MLSYQELTINERCTIEPMLTALEICKILVKINYSNMIYFFFILCVALPHMFLYKSSVSKLIETDFLDTSWSLLWNVYCFTGQKTPTDTVLSTMTYHPNDEVVSKHSNRENDGLRLFRGLDALILVHFPLLIYGKSHCLPLLIHRKSHCLPLLIYRKSHCLPLQNRRNQNLQEDPLLIRCPQHCLSHLCRLDNQAQQQGGDFQDFHQIHQV